MTPFPCRDCGAQVSWAKTNNGRQTLLDEAPVDSGNVAFMLGLSEQDPLELAIALQGDVLEYARKNGVELRTVHFLTCPSRKDKKAAAAVPSIDLQRAEAA